MIISVIADYESEWYKVFLEKVVIHFTGEKVLDLSRHPGNNWKKKDEARIQDIEDSHLVIVCNNWQDNADVRHDLTEALNRKKDIFIEHDGKFVSFYTYNARI